MSICQSEKNRAWSSRCSGRSRHLLCLDQSVAIRKRYHTAANDTTCKTPAGATTAHLQHSPNSARIRRRSVPRSIEIWMISPASGLLTTGVSLRQDSVRPSVFFESNDSRAFGQTSSLQVRRPRQSAAVHTEVPDIEAQAFGPNDFDQRIFTRFKRLAEREAVYAVGDEPAL
jgi:hypothetical protein